MAGRLWWQVMRVSLVLMRDGAALARMFELEAEDLTRRFGKCSLLRLYVLPSDGELVVLRVIYALDEPGDCRRCRFFRRLNARGGACWQSGAEVAKLESDVCDSFEARAYWALNGETEKEGA